MMDIRLMIFNLFYPLVLLCFLLSSTVFLMVFLRSLRCVYDVFSLYPCKNGTLVGLSGLFPSFCPLVVYVLSSRPSFLYLIILLCFGYCNMSS